VTVGNPIQVSSGVKTHSEVDFVTADGRLGLTRTYTSSSFVPTRFGAGWTSNLDRRVLRGLVEIAFFLGDGRVARFYFTSNGWVPATPNYDAAGKFLGTYMTGFNGGTREVSWKMNILPGDLLQFIDEDGTVETYNNFNQVVSIVRPSGYTLTFNYDSEGRNTSVVDTFGRQITFTYGPKFYQLQDGWPVDSLVQTVTAPDGRVYRFEHQPAIPAIPSGGQITVSPTAIYPTHRLLRAIYPDATPASNTDNPRRNYSYEDANALTLLTGVTDERGVRVQTWAYDSEGRGTLSVGPGNIRRHTLTYNDVNGTVRGVNPYNKSTTFTKGRSDISFERVQRIDGAASTNCLASTTSIGFDSNDYINARTDAEGRQIRYTNNARGLPLTEVYGFGTPAAKTINWQWHPTYRIPTKKVEQGLTTDWVVNAAGNITQMTQTDTTSRTVPYSTTGQTRAWAFTYTPTGLLSSINGPLAGNVDLTRFEYDARGYLQKTTNAAGHITLVTSVDSMGRPLTILDPNGVVTAFAYTPRGWVSTITVNPGASQRQTQFTYNAAGMVTGVTLPGGGTLTYTYDDGGRLTQVRNNLNEWIAYTYDANDKVTREERRSGTGTGTLAFARSYVYDELGRVMRSIGVQAAQVERLTYDRSDLVVSKIDPRNMTHSYAYDGVTRLISISKPDSQVVQRGYDGRDNLVSQRDGRNLQTAMVRNGFGEVIRETSPDSGATDYWYDAAGRVTRTVDAAGIETQFTYDVLDRMLTKTFPGSTVFNQAFTYDDVANGNSGRGRATGATDAYGAITNRYDVFGQLTQATRTIWGRSYQTGYSYTALGDISVITYPSGRQVEYLRNNQGQVTSVRTRATSAASWADVVTGVGWQPFGGLRELTFQNGLQHQLTYDQNYWLTRIRTFQGTTTNILDITFGRDAMGNVTSYTDAVIAARNATFTYSNANQLASASSSVWGARSWTYNAAGSRATESITENSTTTNLNYVYPATSNRLEELRNASTNALVRDPDYRANGQVWLDNRVGDGTYQYDYDSNGRMVQVRKNNAVIASYGYDAAGRRILRTVTTPALNRDYLYFPDGRLMAEADATGATVREYIWLGDLPIAIVNRSGSTATTFFVHAGHRAEPLVVTNAARAKVWDAAYEPFGRARVFTSTVEMNLRLPGQQLHAETGLHQNWMRDYDPMVGRYLQPDPIGLEGGPNVYGYVGGDPLNYADPDGQIAAQVGGFVYGAISGGVGGYTTGGVDGILSGAVVGGVVGLVMPTSSFRAGALSNALGQIASSKLPMQLWNYFTAPPGVCPVAPDLSDFDFLQPLFVGGTAKAVHYIGPYVAKLPAAYRGQILGLPPRSVAGPSPPAWASNTAGAVIGGGVEGVVERGLTNLRGRTE
jgi:RHS repeat-associated protein